MQNDYGNDVGKEVIRVICLQIGVNELNEEDSNKPLSDLNLDSFDRMELILRLEKKFSIDIPDDYLMQNPLVTPYEITQLVMALFKK